MKYQFYVQSINMFSAHPIYEFRISSGKYKSKEEFEEYVDNKQRAIWRIEND